MPVRGARIRSGSVVFGVGGTTLAKNANTSPDCLKTLLTKRSKFGAKAVVIDGHRFPSKAEGERYLALKRLQEAGEISGLELQPRFEFRIDGALMFAYIADFRYFDKRAGGQVVEDVKGVKTQVYRLKKKIIERVHKIVIVETDGKGRVKGGGAKRKADRR